MNLRISILLVVILLLFGGAFLVLRLTGTEERAPRPPWLYYIDESTLAHVEVIHAGQAVNYDRAPGSLTWVIQGDTDYPVFMQKWGGTPLLLSGPRVDRVLAEEIEDLGPASSFGLDPPETVVRVTDNAGNTYEFHMGTTTPDGENQYTRLIGDPALFTVTSVWAEVITQRATDPPWGRLYQLEIDTVRVVEVSHLEETTTYFLNPDTGLWTVDEEQGRTVDDGWLDTLQLLSGPRVDKILAREIEDPAEFGLEPPQTRVVLARRGGAPVEFHLGDLTPDGEFFYARVLNTNDRNLYAIRTSRLADIPTLATDPPYATDGTDGDTEEESSG